jgi:polyisoprenoid-binding protein YceI
MRLRNSAAMVVVAAWAMLGASLPAAAQARQRAPAPPVTVRLVVAPEGNEARYRVREQLAGVDLPNDAVGRTTAVTGVLVLDKTGAIVASQSEFTIDLSTLASDQARRDNYVRRNTLLTAEYPRAVFVPTAVSGLTFPLPAAGEAKFQVVGNLTLRAVTRPVTWDVTARFDNGTVTGVAQTKFTFAEFEMTKPRVARVLSVDDDIRLEYEFRLVPETVKSGTSAEGRERE